MPDHIKSLGVEVHEGQYPKVEGLALDYSLVPGWDTSLVSATRGCIRKCAFCAVKRLEPQFEYLASIRPQIVEAHRRIVMWDNNLLASPNSGNILQELVESGKEVDFCQGLDIRLIDREFLDHVSRLKFKILRFAYDVRGIKRTVARHVQSLADVGVRPRDIFFYVLYNFRDSPDVLLEKIQDIMELGCVAYPMRYEPLDSLKRGSHTGANWDARSLDMVNRLRRVLGSHGALPPYDKLKKKICGTSRFEVAFQLRPEHRLGRPV
jgi:hypothetical protein